MSDLNTIVNVVIDRNTQAVTADGFGTPAIISEFATDKTSTTFDRFRYYASLTEMIDDDWASSDDEYKRAAFIFAQNPKVSRVMIGRKTPDLEAVETWTEALAAVQVAQSDWYAFTINSTTEADIVMASNWAETEKKIFFFTSNEASIITNATDDVFSDLAANERTVGCYHPSVVSGDQHFAEGFLGECLPFDPGSQTWAYKTIASLSAYTLTSSEKGFLLAKHGNAYTQVAGVSITQDGTVLTGEYIDIIRGLDWLESQLQTAVFTELINSRKVPYTDEGVAIIENAVRGVLTDAANQGLLIADTIVVTVPKVADVSTANKVSRNLPDVNFTANIQGAIHTIQINGVVTV